MHKSRFFLAIAIFLFLTIQAKAQPLTEQIKEPSRQEILRGSVTPEREWWDVLHYQLAV